MVGRALVETAPTTRAGLRALEAHIFDDRYRDVRYAIEAPIEAYSAYGSADTTGRKWLIAKRAAELEAA
jgi:HEPN domain-containing protein